MLKGKLNFLNTSYSFHYICLSMCKFYFNNLHRVNGRGKSYVKPPILLLSYWGYDIFIFKDQEERVVSSC